jgi:hypothetical protein
MEALTPSSDSVTSESHHSSQGRGTVNPRTAQPRHNVPLLGDTSSARLGQNGRDFVFQEFSSIRLIANTDQSYPVLLQVKGLK